MKLAFKGAAALVALLAASSAYAVFLPSLVTVGSRHDKGFTEMAFNGAERFRKDYGQRYLNVETTTDAQQEQASPLGR